MNQVKLLKYIKVSNTLSNCHFWYYICNMLWAQNAEIRTSTYSEYCFVWSFLHILFSQWSEVNEVKVCTGTWSYRNKCQSQLDKTVYITVLVLNCLLKSYKLIIKIMEMRKLLFKLRFIRKRKNKLKCNNTNLSKKQKNTIYRLKQSSRMKDKIQGTVLIEAKLKSQIMNLCGRFSHFLQ